MGGVMKMCKLIGSVVFSLVFLATLGMDLKAESGELLRNPGFEDFTVSNPPSKGSGKEFGWTPNQSYPVEVVVIENEKRAHSGKVCLRMEPAVVDKTGKEILDPQGAICQGGIAVKPGEDYKLKIWAKGTGRFLLLVYQYNKLGFFRSLMVGSGVVDEQWKIYIHDYTVKQTSPPITHIAFGIHVPDGSIVFLDDASLKKVEKDCF